ncbi:glycosyltransferase family 39 protein [Syncephalastrum racemosum]|uniref:Dolichyl-phosphate-mannose--protein mannosyltransferase n=1 Tax=Syncephalastrum racemosum TaxID=13706 RepID=A0A1X2HMI1_SYNRA|nr:glycosyltransferase family 39 protein [Syncephalastrum racemosum]
MTDELQEHDAPTSSAVTQIKQAHSKDERSQTLLAKNKKKRGDAAVAIGLSCLSLAIRLYKIADPPEVVFDEVHFGTFANHYLHGRFFVDVHPPLAKLLITFVAWLSGYRGEFDFSTIGNQYTADVPYAEMRTMGACMGAMLAPTAFLTLRTGGHSFAASLTAALFICCENGLITNNRLILLDAYLLFFTAVTTLAWVRFFQQRPWSKGWWAWLAATGIGLGLTVSCKWVGLFLIATVGLSAAHDLWHILGDLNLSMREFLYHLSARALCLICIPLLIYVGLFYVHLALLPHSGDGDMHMSADFQHSLTGREIPDSPIDIAYGSDITLRHVATNGGYLHSHASAYPEGSRQQQVTLYPFRDENNWWRIRKMNSTLDAANEPGDMLGSDDRTWLEWVKNGDTVRLEHVATSPRKLHSHNERAPVTEADYHKEVSGYGFPDHEGDANDYWIVEIDQEQSAEGEARSRLQTLQSRIRLLHPLQSCALFTHPVVLPEWGFGQQEVTCIQNGKKPKTIWVIEETRNDLLLDTTPQVNYRRMTFYRRFIELHQVMWKINAGLTESHPFESRPHSWPTLRSGISFWARDNRHIYLLGNPVACLLAFLVVLNFIIIWSFFQVRDQRGYQDHFEGRRQFYEAATGFYVVAWALHYLPFYAMSRQLFLHHYLPALYFSILALGAGLDLCMFRLHNMGKLSTVALLVSIVVYTFLVYTPITYGLPWTEDACIKAQWYPEWKFGCDRYQMDVNVDGGYNHNASASETQMMGGFTNQEGQRMWLQ